MLNLTEAQVVIIQHLRSIEMGKKVDVEYTHAKDDQENIRRSVYLDGGLAMLKYLLGFDAAYLAQMEEEKQALLRKQSGENSATNQSLSHD
jgi:hypothetical protein